MGTVKPRTIDARRRERTARPAAPAFSIERYLDERARFVNRALETTVAQPGGPASRLFDAMRYSLLNGGKRLRPILALASCEAVGGQIDSAVGLACAVEMIHTYSLIHDDLPCMDDDDLRHGHPANHKVFGDALATLAGDALLTDAFLVLARSAPAAHLVLETLIDLAQGAGSGGMVAGQVIDIVSEGKPLSVEQLEQLHSKKTGALFLAAVLGGARLGGASESQLASLTDYGRALGLAFQVIDDVLDVEASTEQMGKRTGKDHARGKVTYPGLLGVEESRGLARTLERRAHRALADFDQRAEPLRRLVTFAVERKR